jgi:hypothetical protein
MLPWMVKGFLKISQYRSFGPLVMDGQAMATGSWLWSTMVLDTCQGATPWVSWTLQQSTEAYSLQSASPSPLSDLRKIVIRFHPEFLKYYFMNFGISTTTIKVSLLGWIERFLRCVGSLELRHHRRFRCEETFICWWRRHLLLMDIAMAEYDMILQQLRYVWIIAITFLKD